MKIVETRSRDVVVHNTLCSKATPVDRKLTVLSAILKKYRYELLESFACYKVVLDGYRALKHVEINGDIIPATCILARIRELDNTNGIEIEL